MHLVITRNLHHEIFRALLDCQEQGDQITLRQEQAERLAGVLIALVGEGG